jgi:hypothetical protein
MKWRYPIVVASLLSLAGWAAGCGDDSKKSSPPTVEGFCAKFAEKCSAIGTQAECMTTVDQVAQSCGAEVDAMLKCAGNDPQITCGADVTTSLVNGCESQALNLYLCYVNNSDAGLGGAGGTGTGGDSAGGTSSGGASGAGGSN